MRRPDSVSLSHPAFLFCIWYCSLYTSLHSWWPLHFREFYTGQVSVWDARLWLLEYSVMLMTAERHTLSCHCPSVTTLLSLHPRGPMLRNSVTPNLRNKPNCFNSASVVTIYVEFELTEWQGHMITRSALVSNKHFWSQEEGWVEWWLCSQGREAMVQHQITANKPLWSKPSAPQSGNMSLLLLRHAGFTEILTEQRDGKGEWGEKASREWEKNAGIKWIKRC